MVFWNLIQKFENLDLEYELACLFGDVWSVLGLDSSVVPRIDSNQLIAQAVSRRVESIQLMIQVAFQGIDSESTHDSRRSPGIDSDRLMTQMAFQWIDSESTHDSNRSPGIESIRLMTQAKKRWFWFDSWFNPESYPCLLICHRNAGTQEPGGGQWGQRPPQLWNRGGTAPPTFIGEPIIFSS